MGKPLKKLSMEPEPFFVWVSMMIGPLPPIQEARGYVSPKFPQWNRGVEAWLKETEKGREFTHCVTSMGEAKCRVRKWLYAYHVWLKRRELDNGRIV